jgi:hypothetical protein
MTIREAIGKIASLPYIGNRAASIRSAKDFETTVANILRNVGNVTERPNGNNQRPAMVFEKTNIIVKTSKGMKPMWNESIIYPDELFIFNGSFGTTVVHGSIVTDRENTKMLEAAKNTAAKTMKNMFPSHNKNFFVSGGRVQFGDNIDWAGMRIEFLNKTIKILEGEK